MPCCEPSPTASISLAALPSLDRRAASVVREPGACRHVRAVGDGVAGCGRRRRRHRTPVQHRGARGLGSDRSRRRRGRRLLADDRPSRRDSRCHSVGWRSVTVPARIVRHRGERRCRSYQQRVHAAGLVGTRLCGSLPDSVFAAIVIAAATWMNPLRVAVGVGAGWCVICLLWARGHRSLDTVDAIDDFATHGARIQIACLAVIVVASIVTLSRRDAQPNWRTT